MTLSSTTISDQYSGDGSTTEFAISFVFWDDADIEAILTDANGTETTWVLGTQYTLSGGSGSTGTLTVDTDPTDYTPASGETLTIQSNLLNKQLTRLPAGGSFPSTSVEQQLDKVVRLIQQLSGEIGRMMKVPTVESSIGNLPSATNRASKFLAFDTNGDPEALALSLNDNAVSAFIATLLDDADAETARTTLGATGLGANTYTGVQRWKKGSDVASANALTLGTDGNAFDITGTTAITSIGTLGGNAWVLLQFDGILTFTHHATDLILPGGANITTAAGDIAIMHEYATGDWRCASYTKADGTAVVAGSSDTVVMSFGALTVAQNSTRYFGGDYSDAGATEADKLFRYPVTGTVSDLYVWARSVASGQTAAVTMRKDAGDTALTATVTGTDNEAADTSNSFAVTVGDQGSIKCVKSATAGNTAVGVVFKITPS